MQFTFHIAKKLAKQLEWSEIPRAAKKSKQKKKISVKVPQLEITTTPTHEKRIKKLNRRLNLPSYVWRKNFRMM